MTPRLWRSPASHRAYVAAAYARVLSGSAGPPGPPGGRRSGTPYTWQELALLPEAAGRDSFASGNPLAFADLGEADRVLDLGCGAGLDLLLAARRTGPDARLLGIDLTLGMVTRARANAAAAGLGNVHVVQGLIEQAPFASAWADWVVSNGAVSLCLEKTRVFAEIARVLAPGGRVVVSDLVVGERPPWLAGCVALAGSCLAGALSEDEWTAGLTGAGLSEIAVAERRPWEPAEIAALVQAELEAYEALCADGATGVEPREATAALAGRVWSGTFVARLA